MKKKGKTALSARLTALCMAALMALSLVPVQTAEAAGETFTKVTSADELTDGRYIMVTDTGYAPGVLDGTWISAEQVIADEGNGIQLGNTIQENADTVWEVSVTSADGAEDLTVTLKDKKIFNASEFNAETEFSVDSPSEFEEFCRKLGFEKVREKSRKSLKFQQFVRKWKRNLPL